MIHPIVLGITGASGAIYAVRLLDVLQSAGRDVHLSISSSGRDVIAQELGAKIDLDQFNVNQLKLTNGTFEFKAPSPCPLSATADLRPKGEGFKAGDVHYFHHQNFLAPMASGSFLTGGMVICPCSGTTLSGIAAGAAGNLIQRAAEVHLKERRKLILVPRETPLSLAHIDNMRQATEAGAVVLPASPGWYHGVKSAADLVDFVVARICDQLGVEHSLMKRWGTS